MNYFTLALRSCRRNARANLAYFISNVIFVFVYVLSEMLAGDLSWDKEFGGDSFAVYFLIYLVLFVVFLFASVGFFLQTRKKEIALYLLHGATGWQISFVIFLENMLIGFFTSLIGIVLGISFYKLFLIFISFMLNTPVLPFFFSSSILWSIVKTLGTLYVVHAGFVFVFLRYRKVTVLLKNNSSPKRKGKISIFLFGLGIVLFAIPLVMKYFSLGDQSLYFLLLPLILIVSGCYLIFRHFDSIYIRIYKQNPEKPTNLMWRAQQLFQPRSTSLLGVVACFFLWISITSTMSLIHSYQTAITAVQEYPFTYYFLANEGNKTDFPKYDKLMQTELDINHIRFKHHVFEAIILRLKSGAYVRAVRFSDYQALNGILGRKKQKPLKKLETIYLASQNGHWLKQKNVNDIRTLQIVGSTNIFRIRTVEQNIIPNLDVIVVSDEMVKQVAKIKTANNFSPHRILPSEKYAVYYIPQWMKDDAAPLEKLDETIYKRVQDKTLSSGYMWDRRIPFGLGSNEILNLLEAMVCFIAGVSFLYFRSYTRLEADQVQYQILYKLGWSEKEMRRLATTQTAFLFFVPFGLAALESIFMEQVSTSILYAIGIQGVGLFLYFVFARYAYLGKVIPKTDV